MGSFSLTTFSPSGKLVQIEYALQAVSSGAPSVGIKAVNGCVLATEKKNKSILFEDHSTYKIEQITGNIGMVYSGMGPDYRLLIRRARKMAQDYYLMYHETIPTAQLVYRVALVMQEYTQSGGVRLESRSCSSATPVAPTLPGRRPRWARTASMARLSWRRGTPRTWSSRMPCTLLFSPSRGASRVR